MLQNESESLFIADGGSFVAENMMSPHAKNREADNDMRHYSSISNNPINCNSLSPVQSRYKNLTKMSSVLATRSLIGKNRGQGGGVAFLNDL